MFTPEDLPVEPVDVTPIAPAHRDLPEIVPGSVVARALYRMWAGDAVVTVKAPPGAGKTYLLTRVLAHLAVRAGLSIHVGCPTRAQALSLADRLADVLPAGFLAVSIRTRPGEALSPLARKSTIDEKTPGGIIVSTLASAAMQFSQPEVDLFVVDEAYQAVYADVRVAAAKAAQVLLVGDPGQIGPVITVNTSMFARMARPPHARAPEVFEQMDGATVLTMDSTFRLGPVGTAMVKPLYGFDFHSTRPHRVLTVAGRALAEVEHMVVPAASPDDLALLTAVADRAELLSQGRVDGKPLRHRDVAVVVSRNSQAAVVSAMLAARGLTGMVVGTADRLQGGQWRAVVALDALAGSQAASGHQVATGRLCVMASRHSAHMTWVTTLGWRAALEAADVDSRALDVRDALCRTPQAHLSAQVQS